MTDRSSDIRCDPDRFPYFNFADFSVIKMPDGRYFSEIAYDVSGRDRAENHLITIVQAELLSCMLMNKGVCDRLQGWSASVGLPEIEHDIADFLERVAQRLGLSQRADLGRRRPATPQALIEDLIPEWYRLQDCLYTAYGHAGKVLSAAGRYVYEELQRPWLWLAYRLTEHVFQEAWQRALGIKMVGSRTSYLDDNVWGFLEEDFEFVFKAPRHAHLAEVLQQWDDETKKARANLQRAAGIPKRRPGKNQQDNAKQDARWLYHQLICGDTERQIVESYHTERHQSGEHMQDLSSSCGCWQRVERGLRNASSLLSATAYYSSDVDK
jgi:hypothetical protein